jgi:pimeloyl-ACP methyl ester carboxylesterase
MVCSYDRAGLGESDEAPDRPRSLDDVVEDARQLLSAAALDGPFLLVGASGGGFDVYHHAGRYPDEVAGLVMVDVPAGQENIPLSAIPAWDDPLNPEHMDYWEVERFMAVDRLPIPAIPVTVLSAEFGQSKSTDEQAIWLEGSSLPTQIVIASGHDMFNENPLAISAAVLAMLEAIRGG